MTSTQPRKQRLALYSASIHTRHKFMSTRLSPDLKKKYGARSIPVRKGDHVRILKGDFRKMEGDVAKVNTKRRMIYVSGVTMSKADGTQVQRPIRPYNVMLLTLAEDKERTKILERRSKVG
jgi:large subunit ribosomal protein L24